MLQEKFTWKSLATNRTSPWAPLWAQIPHTFTPRGTRTSISGLLRRPALLWLQTSQSSRLFSSLPSWFKKSGVHGHWGLWFESLKYRSSWVSKKRLHYYGKSAWFYWAKSSLESGSEDALWRHRISVQTAGLESSSNWANFVGLIWALSLILDDVKSWLARIGV